MSIRRKAIAAIEKEGALLVYPLDNQKLPLSLWSSLYPRSKMIWEWDQEGDRRVADLWRLREELSRSKEVVYAKWYKGRATFFSKAVFRALMRFLGTLEYEQQIKNSDSKNVLEALAMDSPLSTKQLKVAVELQGKLFESRYNRAMKPLWEHLLVVGCGEMDDSSFPSLLMGSSQLLFEELWLEAQELDVEKAHQYLQQTLGQTNPFYQFAQKVISHRQRQSVVKL